VVGNLGALAQSNLKRMLAYSSIAHAGYVLTALVAAPARAAEAVLFYLVAYAAVNLGGFGALAALARAAAPVYVGGALEDGGADITATGGATSTLHDAIYVASAALALGSVTDKALWLLLAFPGYLTYLFVTGVLRPAIAAIFTSTAEEDEAHARELARRDRARAKAERAARGKMARRA